MNRWLPFEWIAAVRFLREGRLQTLFIIGGIAIGVGVIVFMSAMLAGLEANFIKRVLTSQPQIQLLTPDQVARPLRDRGRDIEDAVVQRPSQRVISIDQWPKIRSQMLAMPEVTAVSPTILRSVLAVRGAASSRSSTAASRPNSACCRGSRPGCRRSGSVTSNGRAAVDGFAELAAASFGNAGQV
jgi:lipoprotein-releasing system permease protein